jgi:uncharacterized protein YoaH (UPF0181 family)
MATIVQLYRKYGSPKIAIDFLKARALAKIEMVNKGGWNNLTDEEKDYIILFYLKDPSIDEATNNTNKVTYLMGKGMSYNEAIDYLTTAYSKFHSKERDSTYKRATSVDTTNLLAKYLTTEDMASFLDITKMMIDKYKDEGITGTEYSVVGEGLTDFINSTPGTSFENLGLASQGYVLKTGTIDDLKNGLIDILINGNYAK